MSFPRWAPLRMVVVSIVIILTASLMMGVAGCGGSDASSATTTDGAAAPASSTAPVPSSTAPSASSTTAPAAPSSTMSLSTATSSAAAPAGEIGATVSVASKNGGYPTENVPDWSQIESVLAFRNTEYGDSAIFVCLANYEVTADSLSEYWELPPPGAGQGWVELVLTRTLADTNEPPLVPGRYDFDTSQGMAELTGAAKILVENGTGIQFVTGGGDNYVEVTSVDDALISGTFHVGDNWSEISGSFSAPVK